MRKAGNISKIFASVLSQFPGRRDGELSANNSVTADYIERVEPYLSCARRPV
jgi:hypothetical protein